MYVSVVKPLYYVTPTESALQQEAQPPPEADFYDAFQKLKHALNLLVSVIWDIIHTHHCFVHDIAVLLHLH